jgi:hypothetical protein
VISETLGASCPVDHGDPTNAQNLTDAQIIIQEAAIEVHRYPWLIAEESVKCGRKLRARYLRNRDTDSPAYYLTQYELLGNVRRVPTQALGFRAVYSAMPGIQETLESGFGSTASPLKPEYNAPYGHVHTGHEARLMRLISGKIGRMTHRTFGSFTMEERLLLQDDFSDRSRYARLGAKLALDRAYGQMWEKLPKEVKQAPYESGLEDPVLMRLLGKLVNRSSCLETSFYNASVSGAESGMVMIKHFREALHTAGCPRSLWTPLAYANAAKLSLPSSMGFWDAKKLHEVDVSEQQQPIFIAGQQSGDWLIGFTDPKYQRIYERKRPAGCQGAFILPGQNESERAKLSDWHEFMEQKSQGLRMDTNYRQGTSSAQMATLSAVAIADREGYL